MSSIADRLRGIVRPPRQDLGGSQDQDPRYAVDEHEESFASGSWTRPRFSTANGNRPARIVSSSWIAATLPAIVMARSPSPTACLRKKAGRRLGLLAGTSCGGRLLFVDLETTGLAGGAGSYAFLVGCGWFDRGRFHVRQFLLSSFASERALLEAVRDVAGDVDAVVTYNGKSFDLPLIETRYSLNRLTTPFADMPHVDMLHHARRLWHGDDEGHRLSSLETSLLGHEREGDVAGFEIPARYFRYVHTGDARPLGAVLEHNRLDLLSLALLTARAAQLLDEGVTGASTAREALGMGRLYERAGMTSDALACFARASDMGPGACPRRRCMRTPCCCGVCVATRPPQALAAPAGSRGLSTAPRARSGRSARRASRTPASQPAFGAPPRDAVAAARYDARASRGDRAPTRAIGSQARSRRACAAGAFLGGPSER